MQKMFAIEGDIHNSDNIIKVKHVYLQVHVAMTEIIIKIIKSSKQTKLTRSPPLYFILKLKCST